METDINMVESVNESEILGLATWDQPRTNEQILGFINRREAEIFATEEPQATN